MKNPARILYLIYLATAVHVSAAHYHVYLLGGQSNGNGRADAAQLSSPLDAAQTGVRSDVIHFDHNGQITIRQASTSQMLSLEEPDETGPLVISKQPFGASTASVNTHLVVTFNEPITLNDGGTVTLRDLGPGADVVITLPDARVSISLSGNEMVIDPVTDLLAENLYAVRISADAVLDLSANAFTGIDDDTTWSFSLAPPTPTRLIHHWPLDGDAADTAGTHDGFAVGNASYTTGSGGVFGEAVSLDGGGDRITVGQSSLPATDFTLTAWIYRETAGDFMYIAGTQSSGTAGALLRVEPASGAATANHALFANLLPPAASKRAWGGTIPLNDWTHVAMTVSSTSGLEIFINGGSAGSDATATAHDVWNNFTIGARPDGGANEFDGLIDDVAIFDGVLTSTQLSNVIAHGAANFNGVVADAMPPEVLTLAPADDDPSVTINADLVITFNEAVRKGASGDIVIKEDGGSIFETIPVADSRISVSGSTVTINPAGSFAFNTSYHVQIAGGAIEDLAGNPWTGIANTTSWNFTASAGKAVGTTGIFDENINATNEVDIEVPVGSLGAFKTAVLNAYHNNLGGVIDWETGVTATPSAASVANNTLTRIVAAYGAGGGSTAAITFDHSMDLYTTDINSQINALSQQGTFHNAIIAGGGNDPVGLQYTMTFSGVGIAELGAAMPSRSTYGALGVDFRATANFSGGSSAILDFTVGGTKGTGDTFLHFVAPGGETITSLSVAYLDDNGQNLANGQRRPALDDFGFIVAAPANTFATWISNPVFGIDLADRGFGDDPDGDNLTNGIEAWLGTHPGEFSPGLAQLATDGTTTTFTHPRNENPPSGLTGFYEWSPNLLDWYAADGSDGPFGGPAVTISPNTVGATTTATATASEALDRIFLRAGVTRK